jgi:hypothetical protein
MEAVMMDEVGFWGDELAANDLVLVKVTGASRPQLLRAEVERIYSTGKGMKAAFLGSEVEFVGGGGAWGNEQLAPGDRALVLVCAIHGRLYEHHWHGHMVVEEIEGTLYAKYQFRELWLLESFPPVLRECSRQDPKRPYASAIRFDVMESYLIEKVDRSRRA